MSLLSGQTAVITGGAQGLGFAIAERFVAEGARVVLGDVNLEATQTAAKQLGGDQVALAVRCDVTKSSEVETLIQTAVERWMDSYLGTRFGVPPPDANGAFGDLAAAEIVYKARVEKPGLGTTPEMVKEHEERVRWVHDLAAGRAAPADPVPPKARIVRAEWVSRDGDPVSRERLKGAW